MHSDAIAPISDKVGSKVEDEALCPLFKVAAVMGTGVAQCVGRFGEKRWGLRGPRVQGAGFIAVE
ncbi:hypothetical protein D3C87_1853070 [compost metagenome]